MHNLHMAVVNYIRLFRSFSPMSVINANDELYCDVSFKFKDTYTVFSFPLS
jgi:hypothetical protein